MFPAVRIPGKKIYFMAEVGPAVGDLRATAFEFKCDHGLQRMTDVGLSGAIEDWNQARIHRICLPRIDHPAALGVCVYRNSAHQESILEMRQIRMQRVLGHRYPL